MSSYGKGCKIVPNESLKVHVSVLEDELSSANYKEWFRTLLYMEENRRSELLKERYVKLHIAMCVASFYALRIDFTLYKMYIIEIKLY